MNSVQALNFAVLNLRRQQASVFSRYSPKTAQAHYDEYDAAVVTLVALRDLIAEQESKA